MKRIDKIFTSNPKYKRMQKPLEAARVCDAARICIGSRANVISFRNGILGLSCQSSAELSNLQCESSEIIESINKKIGENLVKKLRFKLDN